MAMLVPSASAALPRAPTRWNSACACHPAVPARQANAPASRAPSAATAASAAHALELLRPARGASAAANASALAWRRVGRQPRLEVRQPRALIAFLRREQAVQVRGGVRIGVGEQTEQQHAERI